MVCICFREVFSFEDFDVLSVPACMMSNDDDDMGS